ncbi:MAG: hypothetical protein HYY06_03010 [Deltaproteobacteria bacterium]|nr:hypothetical protein [Deltaproteobacteria bacterium]
MSTFETVAAVAGALLTIGCAVWWGLWYSRRTRDRLNERVGRVEEAFARVAARLALELRHGETYVHPMAGRYPDYPVLTGTLGERRIRVVVESESAGESGRSDRMAIVVSPRAGTSWIARGRLHQRRTDLPGDAVRSLAELDSAVRSINLDHEVLRVFPRGDRSGSGLSVDYELLIDPDALEQLVNRCAALAALLEQPGATVS